MTTTRRELLAGGSAAVVFISLFLGSGMPVWLALLLTVAVYTGIRVLLPVSLPDAIVLDGGITQAQLQTLVQEGRQQLDTLRILAERLHLPKPALQADLLQLCAVAERILRRMEYAPQSVSLIGLFPTYLETIVRNVQRYVALLAETHGGAARPERLLATEQMVQAAIPAFTHIWERLMREDWLAMEAEAETLKTLFDTDLD